MYNVKLIYNHLTFEVQITIDEKKLTQEEVTSYVSTNKSIDEWGMNFLHTLDTKCNDDFIIIFSGLRADFNILKSKVEQYKINSDLNISIEQGFIIDLEDKDFINEEFEILFGRKKRSVYKPCRKCGISLVETDSYCSFCGTRQDGLNDIGEYIKKVYDYMKVQKISENVQKQLFDVKNEIFRLFELDNHEKDIVQEIRSLNNDIIEMKLVEPDSTLKNDSEFLNNIKNLIDRKPCLPKSFFVSRTMVTQEQFMQVMKQVPKYSQGKNFPLWGETTETIKDFLTRLNELYGYDTKNGFRLLSDFEYAYLYCLIMKKEKNNDYYGWQHEYGWFSESTIDKKPHPVAQKKEDDFGIFDLIGNVWDIVENPYLEKFDLLGGCCINSHNVVKQNPNSVYKDEEPYIGFHLARNVE